MSVADDLNQLAALRRAGALSEEEFATAKRRLLEEPGYASTAASDSGSGAGRRAVTVFGVLTLLLLMLALWGAARAVSLRDEAAAIQDAALVEALGVRVPDPRPAIERMELRMRATGYQAIAAIGLVAGIVSATVTYALSPPGTWRRRRPHARGGEP